MHLQLGFWVALASPSTIFRIGFSKVMIYAVSLQPAVKKKASMQLLGFCVWPSVLHHRCSALSNLKVNSNSLLHIPSPPAAFAEPKNDMICHLQLTSDSESEDKFCPHNSINTTTPQNHKGAWSFCSSKTERPQLYTEMEGL